MKNAEGSAVSGDGEQLDITSGSGMIACFLFRDYSNDPWRIFSCSCKYKHVDLLLQVDDACIAFLIRKEGIKIKRINKAIHLIADKLYGCKDIKAMILAEIHDAKIKTCFPLISSCNELARRLSGIDVGFTLNPNNLYKAILKYDRKRNYQICESRVKIWA